MGGGGSVLREVTRELQRPQDEKTLKLPEEGRKKCPCGGEGGCDSSSSLCTDVKLAAR